ncbi:uncharacterized protein FOMMEDRAFT_160538 [Fomitiporia mediterranea MF3/22]|uniref:uncharacterized protein n=1 Tax=Fomitiporia mediterranea (strain MF3/22) TaxID=694068 RepID=UPI00044087ED|nr:uncharacterized protein FOMMEDRAFT_160538 [Fomitiporia mediterranea MF3/22]EJC99480.1 hypothetical protein FOMMEDRAFT_160538 [Fomitiporia mediterranea MF3/22]
MIRVLALYSRPKFLSTCLMTLFGLEAAAKFGIFIYGTWVQHSIVDWTIPMVYGLILMLLAVYRAAEFWKMEAGLKGLELVKVLIRDQMIYFLLILLQRVGSLSFLSILGSRLFFHMKEAGKLGVNEGTSYRMKTLSNMEFEQQLGNEGSTSDAVMPEDV